MPKPAPWNFCDIAAWLCLAAGLWAAYEARPQDMTSASVDRDIENASRVLAGLPTLPDLPRQRPWNPVLLVASINGLLGALLFGTLASVLRRPDDISRQLALDSGAHRRAFFTVC